MVNRSPYLNVNSKKVPLFKVKGVLVAPLLALLLFSLACSHPRKTMYAATDPVVVAWTEVEDQVIALHESGVLVGADWAIAVKYHDVTYAAMKQIWDVEEKISLGLATYEDLKPLLDHFYDLLKQYKQAGGVQ